MIFLNGDKMILNRKFALALICIVCFFANTIYSSEVKDNDEKKQQVSSWINQNNLKTK